MIDATKFLMCGSHARAAHQELREWLDQTSTKTKSSTQYRHLKSTNPHRVSPRAVDLETDISALLPIGTSRIRERAEQSTNIRDAHIANSFTKQSARKSRMPACHACASSTGSLE